MEKYNISRYEERSDALFICINSTIKPVYIEHFFTVDERKDEESRTATIEKLIAELELMEEAYVEPEQFVHKIEEAKALPISEAKIATAKADIIQAKADLEVEELIVEDLKIIDGVK